MVISKHKEFIKKDNRDLPFVQIPNSLAQNKNLSIEAKGLLLFMLSLPSDWVIHKSWIQKEHVKLGRDRLDRVWKEIQEAGYVEKTQNVTQKGTFNGVTWIVSKFTPDEISLIDALNTVSLKTRITDKPHYGESTPTKKQFNKETLIQSTGTGSNKNLTMNIDENLILSVWKVLKEFIGEKYGTRYIPKGNPKQEDINAIEWGLEIEQDLDDDSTGALFFDYCLERLGEPRNGATKNILLRSYRASLELNDEAWSLDYERYNLMLD